MKADPTNKISAEQCCYPTGRVWGVIPDRSDITVKGDPEARGSARVGMVRL